MIKGLGHIAIRAGNLDESLRFYREVLGLEEAFRLCGDDGKPFLVYLWIAPGQFIELFPDGVREQERGGGVKGFQHICLEVDDVEAEYRRLTEAGIALDSDIMTGRAKCRQFWLHDPDGNPVELMELPPESMQARAAERMTKKAQSDKKECGK